MCTYTEKFVYWGNFSLIVDETLPLQPLIELSQKQALFFSCPINRMNKLIYSNI